jgi:hypothetical protein
LAVTGADSGNTMYSACAPKNRAGLPEDLVADVELGDRTTDGLHDAGRIRPRGQRHRGRRSPATNLQAKDERHGRGVSDWLTVVARTTG